MSLYAINGNLIPDTRVSRIVQSGCSLIDCLFNKTYEEAVSPECGGVDILKTFIMHENIIKLYSKEHILASLVIILILKCQHIVLYPVLYV